MSAWSHFEKLGRTVLKGQYDLITQLPADSTFTIRISKSVPQPEEREIRKDCEGQLVFEV